MRSEATDERSEFAEERSDEELGVRREKNNFFNNFTKF